MEILERMSQALGKEGPPVRLCLIGSAACLFGGMEGRSSRDLDVWKIQSSYDRSELKRVSESVGLSFDPKTVLLPDQPYLQLIEPGLVELGTFGPVLVERMGRLEIYRPPIENLIVSKLIRADVRDLSDIRFLISRHSPDRALIRELVEALSIKARGKVLENLVYLDIFSQ